MSPSRPDAGSRLDRIGRELGAAFARVATAWRILVAGWLAFVVYAYPGYMSYDSAQQLAQARGLDPVTNWHPPVMAYLWRLTDHIVAGPFPMLVIQSVAFMWGCYVLLRRVLSERGAAIAAAAVLLAPPVIAPMAVIWKDSQMAGFLIAGIALLTSSRRRAQLAGCALVFLATAQRYNAAAATLPVMLGLFVWRPDLAGWKRYAIALGAWLVVTAMALVANAVLAEKQEHPFETSLAVFDIAGVIHFERQYEDADIVRDFPGLPWIHADQIKSRVDAIYRGDSNFLALLGDAGLFPATLTDEQRAALRAGWREAVLHHPAAYLRHRARVFLAQLRLKYRRSFYFWASFTDGPWSDDRLGLRATHSAVQQAWIDTFMWLENTPFFWAWVYFVLGIVLVPLCRRDRVVLTILASGLGCELGLFIAAPAVDYRYSHWMVVCTIVGGVCGVARIVTSRTKADGSSLAADHTS